MSLSNYKNIKKLFPIFNHSTNHQPWVYLDSAATTQKPQSVIDAITHYYTHINANVHRGIYQKANLATKAVENVRVKVQKLIHANSPKEIIFTHGTTAAMNMIAHSYGTKYLSEGDEVLISSLAHHSSLLPWQHICMKKGATLKEIPITNQGTINLKALANLLSPHTKVIVINYVSNVLGTINPIQEITQLSKQHHATIVVDAAQAIPHLEVNVQSLNCDILAFSSHKMYGPTGLGILYGKTSLLQTLPPYQLGGGMVQTTTLHQPKYENIPYRFEAGTPNIAGIIGLGAAIDFLNQISYPHLEKHEQNLLNYLHDELAKLPYIQVFARKQPKVSIVSFLVKNRHPLDIAMQLNAEGIALRTGHHCAAPLIQTLQLENGGIIRISLAIYNDKQDIHALIKVLKKLKKH